MNVYASDLWQRAERAVRTARNSLGQGDGDAAASRAYYAAFYAVSALLATEGKTFKKHLIVEATLHKDLVKSGRWPADLGSDYRSLRTLRNSGEQAEEAIRAAEKIVEAVRRTCPELDEGAETTPEN